MSTLPRVDLASRALLVNLTIAQWSGRKLDKDATQAVRNHFGVDETTGNFTKCLIDPKLLDPITAQTSEIRTFHRKNTLPWSNEGARILAAVNFENYRKNMDRMISTRNDVVAAFCQKYYGLVSEQRKRLKDLFNEDEYPMDIESRFAVDIDMSPTPSPDDFRISLDADNLKRLQEGVEKRNAEVLRKAAEDVWTRLYLPIQHIVTTLSKDKPRIYDSLLGNVEEIVNLLPMLNITGDLRLKAMGDEVAAFFHKYTPNDLRDNKDVRVVVAREAQALADKMAGYLPQ